MSRFYSSCDERGRRSAGPMTLVQSPEEKRLERAFNLHEISASTYVLFTACNRILRYIHNYISIPVLTL